jgi:hypothetical protein
MRSGTGNPTAVVSAGPRGTCPFSSIMTLADARCRGLTIQLRLAGSDDGPAGWGRWRPLPLFFLRVSMIMSGGGAAACALTGWPRLLGGVSQRRWRYADGVAEELLRGLTSLAGLVDPAAIADPVRRAISDENQITKKQDTADPGIRPDDRPPRLSVPCQQRLLGLGLWPAMRNLRWQAHGSLSACFVCFRQRR